MEHRTAIADQDAIVNRYYDKFLTSLDVSHNLLRTFLESKDMNDREMRLLSDENIERNSRAAKLLNIVTRKHLVPKFYEALMSSGQWNLAEILSSELPELKIEHELLQQMANGDHKAPVVLHRPSNESLLENMKFYEAEIRSLTDVEETMGVIENLTVDSVDLPFENHLNFDPESQILTCVRKFAEKREHKIYDSAVVVILSHGKNGRLYGVDCQEIEIHTIVSCLNTHGCPDLIDKPKIFIIQACRGEKYDMGVAGGDFVDGSETNGWKSVLNNGSASSKDPKKVMAEKISKLDAADARVICKTPIEADILIAYATTPAWAPNNLEMAPKILSLGAILAPEISIIYRNYSNKRCVVYYFLGSIWCAVY
uniref:Caspase family p20 domain-containing protein n=1 Tax=Romanomermis culicivorax TaxID=13658 RepID=A0A915IAS6_ROMCU